MAFADVGAGGRPQPIGSVPGVKPAAPTVVDTYGGPQVLPKPDLPSTFKGYVPSNYNPPGPVNGVPFNPGEVGGFNPPMGAQQQAPQFQLPDFNTLLNKMLENLGFSQLDNNLQQQRNQLLIRYGDPALASMAGFGADPQSAAFAQQNYLSGNADLARLDKANNLAKQRIVNALAGRGLLFSGETGYDLGQQAQQYGNQRYDLQNAYLDQLNNLLQNTLAQKQALRQNAINSLLGFYSQYAQNPQQLAGIFV